MRWLLPLCALAAVGAVLVAGEVPALRRPRRADRLRPYLPAGAAPATRPPGDEGLRALVEPAVRTAGDRLAAAVGIRDPLERRLARAGTDVDPAGFRLRQAGAAVAALVVAGLAAAAVGLPAPVALVVLPSAALVALLLPEQHLAAAIADREEERATALPVVAEQLGMLLSAGWSLTAALARLGRRGRGVVAEDLRRVGARTRQGLGEVAALREWAEGTDVAAVARLVDVLALHHQTADLGRLIAEEARSLRHDAHRDLLATIERRGQQVWIPVTVATLVPGLVFLAVPFVDALQRFAAT